MNKKDIQTLSDVEIFSALYWIGSSITKEANSKRGVLKKTLQEEETIIEEIAKRFNVNKDELLKLIRK
jgi:hypothetical protein